MNMYASNASHPLHSTRNAYDTDQSSIKNAQLIRAVNSGNLERLRMALDQGADINATDHRGYTPLMILADKGSIECVSELIRRNADLSIKSAKEGYTALMIAANSESLSGNDMAIFSALLEADRSDAHVNCASNSGLTALMIALAAGQTEMALALKEANADINKLNQDGLSALTYAATHGHKDTVDFLMKEDFALSKNQVWEAIGIAAKTNISMCLGLWLAAEENPDRFIGATEDCIIPDVVKIFKNPLSSVANQEVNFNTQNRSTDPALALGSPASSASADEITPSIFDPNAFDDRNYFYNSFGIYGHRYDYLSRPMSFSTMDNMRPLSEAEESDSEDGVQPAAQKRRIFNASADQNHPDNRLVQLTSPLFPGPLESVSSQVPLARGGVFTPGLPDPGPDQPT